jgi:hypothetical protein
MVESRNPTLQGNRSARWKLNPMRIRSFLQRPASIIRLLGFCSLLLLILSGCGQRSQIALGDDDGFHKNQSTGESQLRAQSGESCPEYGWVSDDGGCGPTGAMERGPNCDQNEMCIDTAGGVGKCPRSQGRLCKGSRHRFPVAEPASGPSPAPYP